MLDEIFTVWAIIIHGISWNTLSWWFLKDQFSIFNLIGWLAKNWVTRKRNEKHSFSISFFNFFSCFRATQTTMPRNSDRSRLITRLNDIATYALKQAVRLRLFRLSTKHVDELIYSCCKLRRAIQSRRYLVRRPYKKRTGKFHQYVISARRDLPNEWGTTVQDPGGLQTCGSASRPDVADS